MISFPVFFYESNCFQLQFFHSFLCYEKMHNAKKYCNDKKIKIVFFRWSKYHESIRFPTQLREGDPRDLRHREKLTHQELSSPIQESNKVIIEGRLNEEKILDEDFHQNQYITLWRLTRYGLLGSHSQGKNQKIYQYPIYELFFCVHREGGGHWRFLQSRIVLKSLWHCQQTTWSPEKFSESFWTSLVKRTGEVAEQIAGQI